MANLTKSLTMPDGQEYEFVGKHWYGSCTTAASTQTKYVNIAGFTSADLVQGTQVTVLFSYAQTYNGTPKLNISFTGARSIVGDVKQFEWNASEAITFLYANDVWYIIDSKHATPTYWGKTKLSEIITNDASVALTPSAVYYAHYISQDNLTAATWDGSAANSDVIFDITTPTVDQWETTSDGKQYNVNWTDAIEEAYNTAYDDAQDKATVVKITYGDNIYLLPQYGHMKAGARVVDGDILIDYYNYYAYVIDSAAHAGAYQFKLEVLYDNLYVTYPLMEQYLSSEHYAKTADIPTKVSDLNNDSGFVNASGAASAAPVQSVNGQTGAVTVIEDDKTWNSVRLVQTATTPGTCYIPTLGDYNSSTAYVTYATYNPDNLKIALYDNNSYIHSTTPSANDNSNKVATTAYVDAAIPTLPDVSRFIPTTTNSGAIGARDGFSLYQYSNTSTGGFRRLTLGNDKNYLTSDGAYGVIRFHDGTQYYHGDLLPDLNLYGDQTWTLPAKTGTIALTSDIPDTSTLITNPSTKTADQYLQYNGTNWIASDLPVYDGTVTPSVAPARTAVVKITWNNSTVTTRGFSIVYGREMSTSGNTWYSIELPLGYNQFWFGDKYYTTYMPVPIPASNDDFKAIILFDYNSYVNYARSTSGNISTTSVNCKYRVGDSEWNSTTYYGYVITGDGTITITAS